MAAAKSDQPSLQVPHDVVKEVLSRVSPPNSLITDNAAEEVRKCIHEFISIVTTEAAERCIFEKRKQIHGNDVVAALSAMGYDRCGDSLQQYMEKYRRETSREGAKKKKVSTVTEDE